jgi:hypothetical protein
VTFPAGLSVIEVTGLHLLALDGTPLSGMVVFSAGGTVADPALSVLLDGSGTAEVENGVMAPVIIPTTDCVSPAFVYTIDVTLATPDGFQGKTVTPNVSIPSTLGASVDLSALVPGTAPPASTAFGTANTWSEPQTLAGSPPLKVPGGTSGEVLTSDADGNVTLQPSAGGGSGTVTQVTGTPGNGFTVGVTNGTTTPAVGVGTSVAGLLKGVPPAVEPATAGSDYLAPNGSGSDLTGITASQVGADVSGAAAAAQSAAEAASVPVSALPLSVAHGGYGASTAAQNAVFAGPSSGGAGAPSMRAIAAADVPTLNQSTSGNAATATNFAGGATLPAYVAPAVVTLAFGNPTPVNAALGNDFRLTLTASTGTLATPTNPVDGQKMLVWVTQGTGGGFTLAYGTGYEFTAGLPAPTLSTAAGATDLLGFIYNAAKGKWVFVAFLAGA